MSFRSKVYSKSGAVGCWFIIWLGFQALGCVQNGSSTSSGSGLSYQLACEVIGSTQIACIDFIQNTSANQNSCSTYASRYNLQLGTGGYFSATSCTAAFPSTWIGSCSLSGAVVRYDSGPWTIAAAQADCTSLSGQWGP
jgi:hypothetical protein